MTDVTTYETLSRTHDTAVLNAPSIDVAIERINAVEENRGRRRVGQIEDARVRREASKRKRDEQEAAAAALLAVEADGIEGTPVEDSTTAKGETEERPAKRIALDVTALAEEQKDVAKPDSTMSTPLETVIVEKKTAGATEISRESKASGARGKTLPTVRTGPKVFTMKAGSQLRGHTSYLTFATLLPLEKVKMIIDVKSD